MSAEEAKAYGLIDEVVVKPQRYIRKAPQKYESGAYMVLAPLFPCNEKERLVWRTRTGVRRHQAFSAPSAVRAEQQVRKLIAGPEWSVYL